MDLGQQVLDKNLIYFTLSHNLDYIKLAELCINSLNETGYDGDILFITDIKNELLEVIKYNGNILFMEISENNLLDSSSSKLKIYKYDKISEYNKIIFCDLDTLWLKNPNVLFDTMTENKFYVADDNHTNLLMSCPHHYYGDYLLTDDELNQINSEGVKGFSAGFFALNQRLLSDLSKIDEIYQTTDKDSPVAEQPTVNVYLWRNNLYTNSFNGLVSHGGYWGDFNFNGVLLHFPGGIGNFEIKYNKMKNFLQNDYN